jgi:murein DD-endopeptidase MepM/ murein hydrolase activator NlpD
LPRKSWLEHIHLNLMASKRFTIIVSDPLAGTERRATLPLRPVVVAGCVLLTIPVLVGLGAAWKATSSVTDVLARREALEVENASYRAATESLAGQVGELQSAIADLGARSALDPGLAKAMDKLPALVKARAIGQGTEVNKAARTLSALTNPDDTFGLIRTLLEGLESRLNVVSRVVDRRNALAAATPSIWPAKGWVTSRVGARQDPISGGDVFHRGLDIAADRGQPVYATAAGSVGEAGWSGAYGNLVVINHGFGLESRYGHLLNFAVKSGSLVQRGDLIGHIGSTGRATGNHLHYEVHANGKLLNPLQLLTQQRPRAQ